MKGTSSPRSLPGFVLVYFLVVLALFTGAIAFSVTAAAKKQVELRALDIRESFVEAQKEIVKTEVERIALRARKLRDHGYEHTRQDASERLWTASRLLGAGPVSASRAAAVLGSMAFKPRGVYYIAVDSSSTILFHGSDERLRGAKLSALFDRNPDLRAFFAALLKDGSSYSSYTGLDGERKLIQGVRDPHTGLYLCAVLAERSMDDFMKTQLLEMLAQERFGADSSGYFFIIDDKGVMIMHGIDAGIVGKQISQIKTDDGKSFGDVLSGFLADSGRGGFVRYRWTAQNKSKSEEKTSYVLKIEPWNWIVGSGFYLSDLDARIAHEASRAASLVAASMRGQLFVLALAAFGAMLVGIYLLLRVLRLEKEEARHLNELTRYKILLDESALVSRTDPAGLITYVNDHFCAATGYSREQVIGKSHNIERHPATPKELFQDLWATIKAGRTWHGIIKNRRADGSSYYKKATILPVCDERGEPIEYIAAGQDITELVEQRAALDHVFHTDPLTGLGSRIKLLEDIDRAAEPAVALLDIVDFGRINDSYGEEVGDEVLKECGGRLSNASVNADYNLYRVYADTFAMLADAPQPLSFIKDLRALRDAVIETPFAVASDSLPLDLRIGTASGSKDVLAYADLALGAARDRNIELYSYSIEEGSISESLKGSIDSLKNIHEALRSNRVYPCFQPIADAHTLAIAKYECLIRAASADGSEMQPADFIPVSKKTRLYPSLSRLIIEKSIRAFIETKYEFSINLTLEDLFNASTLDLLLVTAKDAEVVDRIVLEIVETEELIGFDEALKAIKRLKNEGFKLAIDDFGAGYSNFAYLLQLDPDYVKIDGSIISRIVDDQRAEGLARSIVAFCRDAGIKTIAEYVSSEAIAKAATELGVDFLQGYWIGKPQKTF